MMPRRRCPDCGISLPLTREYFYHRNSCDPTTFQNQCIECQVDYARRKRENFLNTRAYRIEHMLDGTPISMAVAEYKKLNNSIKERSGKVDNI